MYYLRARYYDPTTGRFLTRDPFPGLITNPQTLNPYVYVANNPVNLIDPSGLQGWGPEGPPLWAEILAAPFDPGIPGAVDIGWTSPEYHDWLLNWYYPRLGGYVKEDVAAVIDAVGPYVGPTIDLTQPVVDPDSGFGRAWHRLGRPYVGFGIDFLVQWHLDRDVCLSPFQRVWRASMAGWEGVVISAFSARVATWGAVAGAELALNTNPTAFVVTVPIGYAVGYCGTTYALSRGADWLNEELLFPLGETIEGWPR
ncbi:MAG: RHS repeat-associated core domain-containing protein [Anaerolineae bacterium]|nr:RHS repeat-associated core domain-containing protein [Anaerolineae bacterium]